MSKFFIQMVLSLVVAASAAVGFRPEVRGEVNKTLREAKTITRGIAESIFHGASVEAEAEVSTEAPTSTEASLKSEAEVEAELGPNAELALDKTLDGLSVTRAETYLSTESEIEAEVESNHLNLEAENEIESQLDLEAGIGN